jgi:hypothetical protein
LKIVEDEGDFSQSHEHEKKRSINHPRPTTNSPLARPLRCP